MTRGQRTLKSSFEMHGIGLHEGESVRVTVRPAKADTGVMFVRSDLDDSDPIPGVIASVKQAGRRTVLGLDDAEVHTVEHLLAALAAHRIDNVEIEIDGPEMPGLDGSARPWFERIAAAGILEQKAPAKIHVITEPISVSVGGASLTALPPDSDEHEGLALSYTLDYSGYGLAPQYVEVAAPGEHLGDELLGARTFVFAQEIESLQAAGFGKGADASNTIIIDTENGTDGLRYPDEPARHKLLDLLGDLFLVGAELRGRVVAVKSGHALHHELARKLVEQISATETSGRVRRESEMDITEISRLLPHRYPFLLVDRVIELQGYRRAVGIKNVTINEPFFPGHFPNQPIMPGVLILEALAQLAGTLLLRRMEYSGKLPVLWAIDKVKLRRSVVPGDQLRLEVEATKVRDTMGRVNCSAYVNEHVAAEAQMVFTLVEAG